MVTTAPNQVQNNSRNIVAPSILTMQHPLPLSWQGVRRPSDCPANTSFKKHPFSLEFVECMKLQISCTDKKSWAIFDPPKLTGSKMAQLFVYRQEKLGHFWPCQLGSFTPLIFTECKRQGVYFGLKKRFLLFHQFSHKIVTKHPPFFVSTSPMQLKSCNNQPKKRGMSRP